MLGREVISNNPAPKTKHPPDVAECAVNKSSMPKASEYIGRATDGSDRGLPFADESEDLPKGSQSQNENKVSKQFLLVATPKLKSVIPHVPTLAQGWVVLN